MCYANNEMPETTHDGGNRTTKPKQNQKANRKRNLQILGIIGRRQHLTGGGKRKKKHIKKGSQEKEKATYGGKLISVIKTMKTPG